MSGLRGLGSNGRRRAATSLRVSARVNLSHRTSLNSLFARRVLCVVRSSLLLDQWFALQTRWLTESLQRDNPGLSKRLLTPHSFQSPFLAGPPLNRELHRRSLLPVTPRLPANDVRTTKMFNILPTKPKSSNGSATRTGQTRATTQREALP
jgi:hypothetical protein